MGKNSKDEQRLPWIFILTVATSLWKKLATYQNPKTTSTNSFTAKHFNDTVTPMPRIIYCQRKLTEYSEGISLPKTSSKSLWLSCMYQKQSTIYEKNAGFTSQLDCQDIPNNSKLGLRPQPSYNKSSSLSGFRQKQLPTPLPPAAPSASSTWDPFERRLRTLPCPQETKTI